MADQTAAALAAIQDMMAQLTATLGQVAAPAPAPVQPRVSSPPRDESITKFAGDRSALSVFLGKVDLVFKTHPDYFTTDQSKISYVVSRLDGTPAQTIISILSRQPNDPVVTEWEKLKEYLRQNYGDLNEKVTAESAIHQLRQTGKASDYFALFRNYVAVLDWTDGPMLVSIAKWGLKGEIKDELAKAGREFRTLSELMETVVSLDNRLWERRQEKLKEEELRKKYREEADKRAGASGKGGSGGETTTAGGAIRARSTTTTTKVADHPFVPKEEVERRKMAGECLKCCSLDHKVRECPLPYFAMVKQEASGGSPANSGNASGSSA
jgi:hypothetical protein